MHEITIKIINTSGNALPEYATPGAAGMDLRASLSLPLSLKPMERKFVSTGLYLEIPAGYEGQVRPRSGLAIRQGLTCLNSPGTVDSDYRGEIKVILINLSGEEQVIHHGDRIAQIVFTKTEKALFEPSQQLSASVRGEGGFGHTGKN